MAADLVVAADVGGTFTDLVAVDGDAFWVAKVPSTPADPGVAVIEGLEQLCGALGAEPERVAVVLHGTTVATNAVLQRRGARTGLLTTVGFRDVLEIARQGRPRLFDFDARRPEPLIPRVLRMEVPERTNAAGEIVDALDESALRRMIARLKRAGVEAVAVSFLHSYANPEHERRARAVIEDAWPGVHVSISSEVIPEYREYERTSTTAVNALVAPVMRRYLAAMESRLREKKVGGPVRVMQSNGGLMSAALAAELPVATVLSGVAAGALGGVRLASRAGRTLALTLDMGGTSCDLALGIDGHVVTSRSAEIGGLPIRLPTLDVHTIGAGGGSIAHLDPGGGLKVGPRSAGADPGPASYGRGGTEPTVTDANLLLGRLPPQGLIGGALPLDRDLAAAAVARIAGPLGLAVEDAAAGIVRVVNAAMARQMRVLTVERGVDPRECSLVAFGGSGPVHAADLAFELGMREVIVPPTPGVTSALGLVLAEAKTDQVQTVLLDLDGDEQRGEAQSRRLEEVFGKLGRALVAELQGALGRVEPLLAQAVEMRYRRQGHELRVPVADGQLDAAALRALVTSFHDAHRARFGYAVPDEPVLVVNALMTATVPGNRSALRPSATSASAAGSTMRRVHFDGAWHEAAVVPRELLEKGQELHGPAVVEQLDSTTVIPPGIVAQRDENDDLMLRLNG